LEGQTNKLVSTTLPYVVPIINSGEDPSLNIVFDNSTGNNKFTIGLEGEYAIDYFLQVVHLAGATGTTLLGPPVTMQIAFDASAPSVPIPAAVQDELLPVPIFASPWTPPSPISFPYTAVSSGTKHIVRHLYPNNTVQLQITQLPVMAIGATGATGYVPTYLDAYNTNDPEKIVAYVSIHKID
jgi:hypothetical protein